MNTDATTKIRFSSLKYGTYTYHYDVGDAFFKTFENESLTRGNVHFDLTLEKKETAMLLRFDFEGTVGTTCDRCLEEMDIPVSGSQTICIKQSDDEESDNEDLIILPTTAYEVDVAQWMYEFVVVAIPMHHVHADDEQGRSLCNPFIIDYLKRNEEEAPSNSATADPRWDTLRQLMHGTENK